MNNQELAQVFDNIADLLEIKGEGKTDIVESLAKAFRKLEPQATAAKG